MTLLLASVLLAEPPTPKITIGKETTYITEPLRADGIPDYVGYLNEPLKKIDPADNAAVLLVQALGREAASDKNAEEFHRLLKTPRPPEKGEYLVEFPKFLKQKGIEDDEAPVKALVRCNRRPWKSADEPLVAEWLKLNEAPLKLCVEATKRRRCVAPFVSPTDPPMMLEVELGVLYGCRTIVQLLTTRALLHAGEGRVDAAFDDVDAGHRLSTLIGREARMIREVVVANGIRQSILQAEHFVAFAGKLKHDVFRQRIVEAAAHPVAVDIAVCIDQGERLLVLNLTLYSMVYGGKVYRPPTNQPANAFDDETIDEALRSVNGFVDRYVDAARRKPGAKSIAELEDELIKKMRATEERLNTFPLFRPAAPPHPRGPKAATGEAYAEIMVRHLNPAFAAASRAGIRTTMIQRQTILAYALASFKSKHGRYPEKLDAKELGVALKALVDPYSQKPFAYELKEGKRRVVALEPTNTGGMRIEGVGKPFDKPMEHVLELP